MNTFSNILLTLISILYLSTVSDTKCACFGPKTILSMETYTHPSECSTNLKSRRIADRQICSSWSKNNVDDRRSPRYLTEKKCCHQECPAGKGYKCEEYRVPIGVIYHDIDADGNSVNRPEIIHISVACVCAAPRILPEPPKK